MSTPTLNGQVIAVAHYATRAVLERVLAPTGTTYHQSVALNVIAAQGETAAQDRVVARMTDALKIDSAPALAALAELTNAGLLRELPGDQVEFTDAGRALHGDLKAGTAHVVSRMYAELSSDELATAGRVLTVLAERANAELAS